MNLSQTKLTELVRALDTPLDSTSDTTRSLWCTGFLRHKEILALVGTSKVTLWRAVRRGTFPKPVQGLGVQLVWRRSDVQQWLASRPHSAPGTRKAA